MAKLYTLGAQLTRDRLLVEPDKIIAEYEAQALAAQQILADANSAYQSAVLVRRALQQKLGVLNEMVRMLVVFVVVDVVADIVKQRCIGKQLAIIRLASQAFTDCIKKLKRDLLNLPGVKLLVVRPLRELAH